VSNPPSAKEEFEEFQQIYEIVENIRELEKGNYLLHLLINIVAS